MPIKVTCPKCQGVLHAPDDAGGKRGKCPTCGTVLSIPAIGGGGSPPPMAPPAPPVAAPRPASLASMPDFGDDDNPRGTMQPGGDLRHSSFTDAPKAAEPNEPRRAQPQPNRLPPPPTFGPTAGPPQEPRKADPFAKPGKPPTKKKDEKQSDGGVKAMKRARRGLWLMQFALVLFLLAPLALIGINLAEKFGAPIPNQSPGYLKIDNLSTGFEIRAAAVLIPFVIGYLALILGRFGAANAPRWSSSKGLGLASAIATLFVFLGMLAISVMIGVQISDGFMPTSLSTDAFLPPEEVPGIVQRIGLAFVICCFPLAEVWSAIALGRLGATLKNSRLAGRSARFLLLMGLALIAIVFVSGIFIEEKSAAQTEHSVRSAGNAQSKNFTASRPFAKLFYVKDIEAKYNEVVTPQWEKLGDHRDTTAAVLTGLGILFVWFLYARLVGGARRAIREWLAEHEPVS